MSMNLKIVEKASLQENTDAAEGTHPVQQADSTTEAELLVSSEETEKPSDPSLAIELTRLTNIMTGCFNPSLSPDRKNLLFSAYQNGKYDVCLMDTSKTIEEKIEPSDVEEPSPILIAETPENL